MLFWIATKIRAVYSMDLASPQDYTAMGGGELCLVLLPMSDMCLMRGTFALIHDGV